MAGREVYEMNEAHTDEGKAIPVRWEGDYPVYTDEEGKSLSTGEDIAPGSPLAGEGYEHNVEKAHEMAKAGTKERSSAARDNQIAAKAQKIADDQSREPAKRDTARRTAALTRDSSAVHTRAAMHAEELAGRRYDSEKGVLGSDKNTVVQELRGRKRENNERRAETMAYAGDQDRTKAVAARRVAGMHGGELAALDNKSDPSGQLRESARLSREDHLKAADAYDVLAQMRERKAGLGYDREEKEAARRIVEGNSGGTIESEVPGQEQEAS